MKTKKISTAAFRSAVYRFYAGNSRDHLPWRHTFDPYRIVVSEVMLQQTQVSRALVKFPAFVSRFPTLLSLAKAGASEVLQEWQGLGYNRRALYLKKFAEHVIAECSGVIPSERSILRRLPGIGDATAGSICAFAFNKPEVFIETNIRSVFIHHFFSGSSRVEDTRLLPLVKKTLDRRNPRRWYSALMDYGVHLKKVYGNPSRNSRHYVRQSPYEGSDRQRASALLKFLLKNQSANEAELFLAFPEKLKTRRQLTRLVSEGFAIYEKGRYRIG